jgi:hypothetical protein
MQCKVGLYFFKQFAYFLYPGDFIVKRLMNMLKLCSDCIKFSSKDLMKSFVFFYY